MKIVWFDNTGGACDWYRATQPMRMMSRAGLALTHMMTRADFISAAYQDRPDRLERLMAADVILIPRLPEKRFYNLVKEVNPTAKIVLDYDDNIFDVSPLSPHYEDHGVKPVKFGLPDGQIIDLWVDKKGFDPKQYQHQPALPRAIDFERNAELLSQIKEVMGMADMVTVTTDILAEAFRPYSKNVVVLPNCIDNTVWKKLPLLPRKDVRMGWFGGSSHYEDLVILQDILPKVMEKNPHLKMVVMGAKFDAVFKDVDPKRIEYHGWVETPAYPYKAAILDLDFAVIPLRESRFNACKSAIKWIEMASLGVPAVTSYVSPYKEVATEGNGMWIEANDPRGWIEGIEYMANDAKLRSQIAAEAMKTVMENFEIHSKVGMWSDAYKGVINNGFTNTTDSIVAHT